MEQVSAAPAPGVLARTLGLRPGEGPALALAFACFFSLLSGYYVLRSVRDAMIAADGTRLIPTVFTSVFVCMLLLTPVYGAVVSRLPRRVFLPLVFTAVIVMLGVFALAFRDPLPSDWVRTAFAIFLSVMNLFTVSVFWSFLSDIFASEQAKRLYGVIAAGGTAGALAGPLVTRLLVAELGIPQLMLVSILGYLACLGCIFGLIPWARRQDEARHRGDGEQLIGGSIVGGAKLVFSNKFMFALVLHMFFGVSVGTLFYNQQAAVLGAQGLSAEARAEFFAGIDLAVNGVAIVVQLLATRILLPRYGAAPLLMIAGLLAFSGVGALALLHSALLLSAVQVTTRGLAFSIVQPARESLYTQVDREMRYKAKNFIDTVVYRGADMVTSWSYFAVMGLGLTLGQVSAAWLPVAAVYLGACIWLLRMQGAPPPVVRPDAERQP